MRWVWGMVFVCIGCTSAEEPAVLFTTQNPFEVPEDSLATSDVEACGMYLDEVCEAGRKRTCSVYDAKKGEFVTPDALTHRAFLYERWYERYHSPDGIHAKRQFNAPTTGTMSEAEWGADALFDSYNGMGDSAIWTGTALNAKVLRYVVTGTELDYQRMEDQVRSLLTLFEVTGIDGYLARYHYLRRPAGSAQDDTHAIFFDDQPLQHIDYEIENPVSIPDLPAVYTDGSGVPHWHGAPSIDQYSGLTTSLPAAWGLLRDESLKARIAHHLGCYLKRLRRMELVNVQKNRDAKEVVSAFFENTGAQFDEDDVDLTKLDTVVIYYLEQPNSLNTDTFDPSCPSEISTTPVRTIDATDGDFLAQMLDLVADINGAKKELRATNVDHYYLANARGADAVHLMGLAAMNHHFTGEQIYADFLEKELIGNLNAIGTANTYAAVNPPKWCRKWYASHISIGPLWGLLNLLGPSTLDTRMQEVMYEEAWLKDAVHLDNVKFSLMFAGSVSSDVGSGQSEAGQSAIRTLSAFGGNGGMLDAPRRTFDLPYETVAAQLPDHGITAECPTEQVVRFCEEGQTAFGIAVNPFDITEDCTGADNECPAYNGQCAPKRASSALPIQLRGMWGFQWQGDPYSLGAPVPPERDGLVQGSGIDLIESYWLARHYGYLPDADAQTLAWQDAGACP